MKKDLTAARDGRQPAAALSLSSFGGTAKSLARSPLGIIALFIVLIYALATILLGVSATSLSDPLKTPLIWFLVIFPALVLGIFSWLVACHHTKLYGPSDFLNQEHFLQLQKQLTSTQRRVDTIVELNDAIALPPLVPTLREKPVDERHLRAPEHHPDDPQKGRWGGRREAASRILSVGPIRPLKSDPGNYRVPLEVRSTDPAHKPLMGNVRFHLHDTFGPDVEEVAVKSGAARLTLAAYGAFTVGAETDDGAKLELDLSESDIDAPEEFKRS